MLIGPEGLGMKDSCFFMVMTMTVLSEMGQTGPVLWFVKITWIKSTPEGFANVICALAFEPREKQT